VWLGLALIVQILVMVMKSFAGMHLIYAQVVVPAAGEACVANRLTEPRKALFHIKWRRVVSLPSIPTIPLLQQTFLSAVQLESLTNT
jgi:hypothetical protein